MSQELAHRMENTGRPLKQCAGGSVASSFALSGEGVKDKSCAENVPTDFLLEIQ